MRIPKVRTTIRRGTLGRALAGASSRQEKGAVLREFMRRDPNPEVREEWEGYVGRELYYLSGPNSPTGQRAWANLRGVSESQARRAFVSEYRRRGGKVGGKAFRRRWARLREGLSEAR